MISACIIEAGIDSTEFAVTPFPIETPDQLWNYAPLGAVCYLTINDEWGDEKARRLRQQGFKVHVLWRTKTKELSGTELRAAIRHGEHTWESSVPPATVRFLGASGALERIRGDRHPPGFEPGIQ
jgi:hypothetical protein